MGLKYLMRQKSFCLESSKISESILKVAAGRKEKKDLFVSGLGLC